MHIEDVIPSDWMELASAQEESQDKLLALPNVVGTAVGHRQRGGVETDERVVTVFVEQKLPLELLPEGHRIPKKVKGTPVDVVEVGEIFAGAAMPAERMHEPEPEEMPPTPPAVVQPEAGPAPLVMRRRMRPVMGGCSIGHYRITAGTVATCCYDLAPFPGIPARYYILSNNHVLANSNAASIGDPILQPGPYDGGSLPGDTVARLSRYVPIRFMSGGPVPCNYVDAAIAEGDFADLSREIYWVGYPRRLYRAPRVGMIVEKCGRTTSFTTGRITHINATVNVNYGGGRVARFCRQIVTTRMGAPGDSGSLVMDTEEGAVGLLFAGSATATIMNSMWYVQSLLRIRITER